jgi:adenylosuccinate synthase
MMKADVLNSFSEINVCTHYKFPDGSQSDALTYDSLNQDIEPIYKSFQGWGNLDVDKNTAFRDLPDPLKNYIQYLEGELDTPINIISFGPDRSETMIRN